MFAGRFALRLRIGVVFVGLMVATAIALPAAGQTWTGATSGNWNTASNWSPAVVPNSATADVLFPFAGVGSINIATSVQARSLTFDSAGGGNYMLTSSAGQTLTGVSAINLTGVIFATQSINLANVATGSMLVPGTGAAALTITNGADATVSTTPTLEIGPTTVIGRSGAGSPGITFTGTGTTEINGTITSTMTGGITIGGVGKVVISGLNSGSGGTTFAGGTLILDYSAAASRKLPTGTLALGGGDLTMLAHATTPFIDSATSTNLTAAGHTALQLTTGNGTLAPLTLSLGALTRSAGSSMSVVTQTNANVTTALGTTNGILGGWVTDGSANWVTKSGSNIVPLASYGTDLYSSGTNTNVTIGTGIPSTFTTNSLRFNTNVPGGMAVFLNGSNNIQSGGILMGSSASDVTIAGGSLTAVGPAGELFVHQFSSAANLTINSSITALNGLTKTGPGLLTLGGSTSLVDGAVNINRGSIRFTNALALSPLVGINFNDNRGGAQQQLVAELGDGVSTSSSAPIRLNSAGDDPLSTTLANTFANDSPNSRVTFSNIISSPRARSRRSPSTVCLPPGST
jgi:autotransporter-associated beta strand protein